MKSFKSYLVAESSKDPCWKNYKQIGTKKKNGKEVPNCVPKESVELDEASKGWKKINSYLLGEPAEVYTNDSGYTFGKVNHGKHAGKFVMVNFDDEVIHVDKSAAAMKRHYKDWFTESVDEDVYEMSKVEFMEMDLEESFLLEAEYKGKKVTLNKPFYTPDGPKKSAVYVKKGDNVVIVRFGDPDMTIKKNDPARRKSFRARHKCDQQKDVTSAAYWSCKAW